MAEDVTFHYAAPPGEEPVLALTGVGLTVRRGEFVAVVGPNGSGKSTLAQMLNALLVPLRGRVTVDGLDTSDPASVWPIHRVGMVFQNPDNQIVAAMVEEDVAFGPENQALPPAEIRQRRSGNGWKRRWQRWGSPPCASGRPTCFRGAEATAGHRRGPGPAFHLPGVGRAYGHAGPPGAS